MALVVTDPTAVVAGDKEEGGVGRGSEELGFGVKRVFLYTVGEMIWVLDFSSHSC